MTTGGRYDTHLVTPPQRGLQPSRLRFRVHHPTNLSGVFFMALTRMRPA